MFIHLSVSVIYISFIVTWHIYNMNNDNGCVSGAPWNILSSCTLEIYIYCLYICIHFWHIFTHLYWRDANWRKQNGCLSFGVFFCVFCICRTCFWTFMCFFINKWGAPQVPLSNTYQFHIRKNLNIHIYIYNVPPAPHHLTITCYICNLSDGRKVGDPWGSNQRDNALVL